MTEKARTDAAPHEKGVNTMTIGERIKELRKSKGLTLEKFGAAVRIKAQSVSKLEKGENNPSGQTISLICREFRVNETWLRTGEGEMNAPDAERERVELVDAVVAEYGLTEVDRSILTLYLELEQQDRDQLNAYVLRTLREALKSRAQESPSMTDEEIAEQVARYESLLKGVQQIERLPTGSAETPKPVSASSGADMAS